MTKCYITSLIDDHLAREADWDSDQEWADEIWENFIDDKYIQLDRDGFLKIGLGNETVESITAIYAEDEGKKEELNNALWFMWAKDDKTLMNKFIQESIEYQYSKEVIVDEARKYYEDLRSDY